MLSGLRQCVNEATKQTVGIGIGGDVTTRGNGRGPCLSLTNSIMLLQASELTEIPFDERAIHHVPGSPPSQLNFNLDGPMLNLDHHTRQARDR